MSAPLQVRVIEYLIDPPVAQQLEQVTPSRLQSHSSATNPQVRQVHRLITTLLSPELASAKELCLCYHERWEVEETIDETRNQQRLSQQPLRSRLPKLVLQEFYALRLSHYAVRCLMLRAAQSTGLDPDRISFTGAIQVLGQAIVLSAFHSPELVVRTLKRLRADLTSPAPWWLRGGCVSIVGSSNTSVRASVANVPSIIISPSNTLPLQTFCLFKRYCPQGAPLPTPPLLSLHDSSSFSEKPTRVSPTNGHSNYSIGIIGQFLPDRSGGDFWPINRRRAR